MQTAAYLREHRDDFVFFLDDEQNYDNYCDEIEGVSESGAASAGQRSRSPPVPRRVGRADRDPRDDAAPAAADRRVLGRRGRPRHGRGIRREKSISGVGGADRDTNMPPRRTIRDPPSSPAQTPPIRISFHTEYLTLGNHYNAITRVTMP